MKRKAFFLLAAAALFAGILDIPAASQEAADSPDRLSESHGKWTLRCGPGDARCHVFQSLYRADDKSRLIQVTLFSPPGAGGAMFLRTLTPLGAVLANGSALIVDEAAPRRIPFISCWPRGCMAETPLAGNLLASLRTGKILAVEVISADTGQVVRFELSLDGISAALDRFGEM